MSIQGNTWEHNSSTHRLLPPHDQLQGWSWPHMSQPTTHPTHPAFTAPSSFYSWPFPPRIPLVYKGDAHPLQPPSQCLWSASSPRPNCTAATRASASSIFDTKGEFTPQSEQKPTPPTPAKPNEPTSDTFSHLPVPSSPILSSQPRASNSPKSAKGLAVQSLCFDSSGEEAQSSQSEIKTRPHHATDGLDSDNLFSHSKSSRSSSPDNKRRRRRHRRGRNDSPRYKRRRHRRRSSSSSSSSHRHHRTSRFHEQQTRASTNITTRRRKPKQTTPELTKAER